MARRSTPRGQKMRRPLSSRARAVMKAFRAARSSAPQFMCACGIFPEVSESASDGLHEIVNELATNSLRKRQHLAALQKRIDRLLDSRTGTQSHRELFDQISTDLTALLASEATAAYLFGLSVGLTVHSLPERIEWRD